jgi:hypothetical protein
MDLHSLHCLYCALPDKVVEISLPELNSFSNKFIPTGLKEFYLTLNPDHLTGKFPNMYCTSLCKHQVSFNFIQKTGCVIYY